MAVEWSWSNQQDDLALGISSLFYPLFLGEFVHFGLQYRVIQSFTRTKLPVMNYERINYCEKTFQGVGFLEP